MATTKELKEYNNSRFEGNTQPSTRTPPKSSGNIRKQRNQFLTSYGSSITGQGVVESPFASDFFTQKLFGVDFGEVVEPFKNPVSFMSPFEESIDYEQMRAQEQSAFFKLGSGAVNFLGKTGLATVGNVVGGFYGLGSAVIDITQGVDKKEAIKQLWDNSVYKTLDEAEESMNINNSLFVNPNSGFGFNAKTGKELYEAFAFVGGMVGAEMVMQTVGNLTGGLGAIGATGRGARYLSKINQIFNTSGKFKYVDDLLKANTPEALDAMARQLGVNVKKLAQHRRVFNGIKSSLETGRRLMTSTGYEAALEARGVEEEFIQTQMSQLESDLDRRYDLSPEEKDQIRAEQTKKIQENATKAGWWTFGLNTGLLSVSNTIQFPTLLGSSYKNMNLLNRIQRKGIDEVAKAGNKEAVALTNAWRIIKTPLTEAAEEQTQRFFSTGAKTYYDNMLGTDTNSGVLRPQAEILADTFYKSFEDAYTSKEGLHEGLIGAIVGAVGIPGFKQKNGKIKMEMQGGIAESIRNFKTERQEVDDAIAAINNTKMSDVLKYNKDNAIIAMVDQAHAEKAIYDKDALDLERVEDNKVFRYVIDRMSKNLGSFIDKDINEISELANTDIEQYKKLFGKADNFTQQDAQEEINTLKQKVEVYKDSYNKVHKHLRSRLLSLPTGAVEGKLARLLTYAVSTEKLKNDRLTGILDELTTLNHGLTKEELKEFTDTAGAIHRAKIDVDKYSQEKREEKIKELTDEQQEQVSADRNAVKEQLDPQYQDLLDMPMGSMKILLESLQKGESTDNQERIDNVKKAIALKEIYDSIGPEFQANKSSKARALKDDAAIETLTKEINNRVEKSFTDSLKALTGSLSKTPEKTLTTAQVKDYLEKRNKIKEALAEQETSDITFDLIAESEKFAGVDLLDEAEKISSELREAAMVAKSLFGKKTTDAHLAYNKVIVSELAADVENAVGQAIKAVFSARLSKEITPEVQTYIDEAENSLEIIKNKYSQVRRTLNEKGKKYVEKHIQDIEFFLEEARKNLNLAKKLEKQEAEVAGKKETIIPEDPTSEVIDPDNPENTGKVKTKDQQRAESIAKLNNYWKVFTTQEDGSLRKGFPEVKQLVDDGTFQKTDDILSYISEDEMDTIGNTWLDENLNEEEKARYNAGRKLVEDNPNYLNSPEENEDVLFFLSVVPVKLSYREENTENEKYNHYLPRLTKEDLTDNLDERLDEKLDEDYKHLLDEEPSTLEEVQGALSTMVGSEAVDPTTGNPIPETDKKEIERYYKNVSTALDIKRNTKQNARSNFSFRKALLKKFYGENEADKALVLKFRSINLGNYQKTPKGQAVPENSAEELFDPATIDPKDIYITAQEGKYVEAQSMDKVEDMLGHPFQDLLDAKNSSDLYISYKKISGDKVPVKMNTKRLGNIGKGEKNYTEVIYNQMLKYFESDVEQPRQYKIKDKTGILPIDNRKDINLVDFMNFFIRPKQGKGDPAFLKHTFTLLWATDSKTRVFKLHNGESTPVTITSLEDLKSKKSEVLKALREMRFTVNRDFLFDKDNNLQRDNLKYYFDNKIINHHFTVDKNFDKIYDSKSRRYFVLFNPEQKSVRREKRLAGYNEDLQTLFKSLAPKNQKKDAAVNAKSIQYRYMDDLKESLNNRVNTHKAPIDKETLFKALDSILESKLRLIQNFEKQHAGSIKNTDHHKNYSEKDPNDSTIDKLLKYVYFLDNIVRNDKVMQKSLLQDLEIKKAQKELIYNFRENTVHTNIQNFTNKEEQEIAHNMSKEQFTALIRTLNLLTKIKDMGYSYVDITYKKDWKENKKAPTSYNYIGRPKKGENHTDKHYGTKFKSITLEGPQPQWNEKTGKITGGAIYMNVGSWYKDKKTGKFREGNNKLLVVAGEELGLPSEYTNIVTHFGFPTKFFDPASFVPNVENIKLLEKTIAEGQKEYKKRGSIFGKKVDEAKWTEEFKQEEEKGKIIDLNSLNLGLEEDSTPDSPPGPLKRITEKAIEEAWALLTKANNGKELRKDKKTSTYIGGRATGFALNNENLTAEERRRLQTLGTMLYMGIDTYYKEIGDPQQKAPSDNGGIGSFETILNTPAILERVKGLLGEEMVEWAKDPAADLQRDFSDDLKLYGVNNINQFMELRRVLVKQNKIKDVAKSEKALELEVLAKKLFPNQQIDEEFFDDCVPF